MSVCPSCQGRTRVKGSISIEGKFTRTTPELILYVPTLSGLLMLVRFSPSLSGLFHFCCCPSCSLYFRLVPSLSGFFPLSGWGWGVGRGWGGGVPMMISRQAGSIFDDGVLPPVSLWRSNPAHQFNSDRFTVPADVDIENPLVGSQGYQRSHFPFLGLE